MDRSGKNKSQKLSQLENHPHRQSSQCALCKRRFKSRSHLDAICDVCWADNEMRPYLAVGGLRGAGFVN
jgi:hypothetical protein